MYGGPWSDVDDLGPTDDNSKLSNSSDPLDLNSMENCNVYYGANGLWPRKRRMSERDAAFGLNTSIGLGAFLGIMGSRRDVVTAVWKTGLEGVWYKVRYVVPLSLFTYYFNDSSTQTLFRKHWDLRDIDRLKTIQVTFQNLTIWDSKMDTTCVNILKFYSTLASRWQRVILQSIYYNMFLDLNGLMLMVYYLP